jgi:hypothetical protein
METFSPPTYIETKPTSPADESCDNFCVPRLQNSAANRCPESIHHLGPQLKFHPVEQSTGITSHLSPVQYNQQVLFEFTPDFNSVQHSQ